MSLTGNAQGGYNLRGKLSGLKTIHGYSAYEVAVINGFSGTEEEWLESLKPKKGVDYFDAKDKREIVDEVLADTDVSNVPVLAAQTAQSATSAHTHAQNAAASESNALQAKTAAETAADNAAASAETANGAAGAAYDYSYRAGESAQQAQIAAVKAERTLEYTHQIGGNGNWWYYNRSQEQYVDSGIPATGPQGERGYNGLQGERGEAGKTPVKGTDYWTPTDKAEIVEDVLAEVPSGGASSWNDLTDKPFGSSETVLWENPNMPMALVDGFYMYTETVDFDIVPGNQYTVVLDGIAYNSDVYLLYDTVPYIGNPMYMGFEDNGLPFFIAKGMSGAETDVTLASEFDFDSISVIEVANKKIDEKFIPDTIQRTITGTPGDFVVIGEDGKVTTGEPPAGGGEEWEVIADVTLEEQAVSFVFDDFDKPYKRVFFVLFTPADSTLNTASKTAAVSINGQTAAGLMGALYPQANFVVTFDINTAPVSHYTAGGMGALGANNFRPSWYANVSQHIPKKLTEAAFDEILSIQIEGERKGFTFPVGTILKIWGVPK